MLHASWVPLDEAVELATSGRLRDAKSIVGLVWAASRLASDQSSKSPPPQTVIQFTPAAGAISLPFNRTPARVAERHGAIENGNERQTCKIVRQEARWGAA